MIQKKSDDAVSPVLGVMLMVVITVVIGAVIAAFATGMVADTEPTPNAVLKVEILSNSLALEADGKIYAGPDFQITHISGDAVDTGDIEIQLSWTHDGCSHYSTYSAEQVYAKYPIKTDMYGMEIGPPFKASSRREAAAGGQGAADSRGTIWIPAVSPCCISTVHLGKLRPKP